MSYICQTLNTSATIGSTFILQVRLMEETTATIDITAYHVAMAAKSKAGTVLFTADSEASPATIVLDAEDGATIQVLVPESTTAQVADYDVLIEQSGVITPIIRGEITLLRQITDLSS